MRAASVDGNDISIKKMVEAEVDNIGIIYEISDIVRKKLSSVIGNIDDETVMAAIHREILLNPISRNLKLHEKQSAAEGVFNALRRELDFLEKYLKDPQISEIMVNGHDDIFIEKNGRIVKIPEYFPSSKELEEDNENTGE